MSENTKVTDTTESDIAKAMAELDSIEKSVEEPQDELDELTKALEDELGEDLSKACKKDEKCDEDDEDDEDDEKDEGAEPKPFGKSQDDDYDEELVKASEAFASLEKSMGDNIGVLANDINDLRKSLAALLNLNIKMAKVTASLVKSHQDDSERLAKSMATMTALGSTPVAPGKAVIGVGSAVQTEGLQKSTTEVRESLIKSVSEGKVEAKWLGVYDRFKTTDIFTDEVKNALGI